MPVCIPTGGAASYSGAGGSSDALSARAEAAGVGKRSGRRAVETDLHDGHDDLGVDHEVDLVSEKGISGFIDLLSAVEPRAAFVARSQNFGIAIAFWTALPF
jgi:hypothetical protein